MKHHQIYLGKVANDVLVHKNDEQLFYSKLLDITEYFIDDEVEEKWLFESDKIPRLNALKEKLN